MSGIQRMHQKIVCCLNCHKELMPGNIRRHLENCCRELPTCPQCGRKFRSEDGSITCSHRCSNLYFVTKRRHAATDQELIEQGRYTDLCFRYHERKCIICGEQKIVCAHHVNKNHSDHRIENLVPLYPTHHQYVHSRFEYLVRDKIDEYVKIWMESH